MARELSVSSERQGGGGRNPRPYSGSRYKYLGEFREKPLKGQVEKGHHLYVNGSLFQLRGCFYVSLIFGQSWLLFH